MSYLDQPRINFTGRFYTNVSTINNDLTNYDPSSPVGDPGWNPNGVALFKFDSCKVTSVQAAGDNSKLIGSPITTSAKPAPGKLVDLDPEQQMLSQVIGVSLHLTTKSGAGFKAILDPCNFQDIWMSAPAPKGIAGASNGSVIFVSTLSSVQWTNANEIEALKLLSHKTQNSQLAIRLLVSCYYFAANPNDPNSGYGQLTGSIGPHVSGEPAQFARRRLILPSIAAPAPQAVAGVKAAAQVAKRQPIHADFEVRKDAAAQVEAPAKPVAAATLAPPNLQACYFELDAANSRLSIDLANSVPLESFGGPPLQIGQLQAVIVAQDGSNEPLGQPFKISDFTQGGIADVKLTANQAQKLGAMRAGLVLQQQKGVPGTLVLVEHKSGKYVGISPFTARCVGGESVSFELRAFKWGKPLAGETLALQSQVTEGMPASLKIQSDGSGKAVTDQNGRAVFTVKSPAKLNIPEARQQLDSLVYNFSGPWTKYNGVTDSSGIAPASLLVWAPYKDADLPHPTWAAQVQPIFDEYMRIYPGMKQIMDLTNLSVVQANKIPLLEVLSLPFEAPHRMPVTRDLSPQKIEVIKTWLKNQIAKKKKGAFAKNTHGRG
jgi:hypothetical protein